MAKLVVEEKNASNQNAANFGGGKRLGGGRALLPVRADGGGDGPESQESTESKDAFDLNEIFRQVEAMDAGNVRPDEASKTYYKSSTT